jgi:hypothetical protein
MSDATEAGGLQADTPEPAAGGLDAILDTALESYGDEAPASEAVEQTEPKSDDRPRDAQGRFAPKDPAEPEPSPAEPATAEATPEQPSQPDPAQAQPVEPHPRWSPELKAQFATWPKDVQEAFKGRYSEAEADYTRKTQEAAELRKGVEPLANEAKRLEPLLQQWQTTPDDFFRRSAEVVSSLTSPNAMDRVNTAARLISHYQVPLDALLQTLGIPLAAGEGGQVAADPTITQLRQHVSGLEAKLQHFQEQASFAERQRAEAEFNALALTKDDSGKPKYPHFDRVKGTMLHLVASDQAKTWDEAYPKAVRLDDELFQQTLEAERASVRSAEEKARLEAVEKAKKAKPVQSSSASPQGGAQRKGIDAHLGAALERHFGG